MAGSLVNEPIKSRDKVRWEDPAEDSRARQPPGRAIETALLRSSDEIGAAMRESVLVRF